MLKLVEILKFRSRVNFMVRSDELRMKMFMTSSVGVFLKLENKKKSTLGKNVFCKVSRGIFQVDGLPLSNQHKH